MNVYLRNIHGKLRQLLFSRKTNGMINCRDGGDMEEFRGNAEKEQRANGDKLSPSAGDRETLDFCGINGTGRW